MVTVIEAEDEEDEEGDSTEGCGVSVLGIWTEQCHC